MGGVTEAKERRTSTTTTTPMIITAGRSTQGAQKPKEFVNSVNVKAREAEKSQTPARETSLKKKIENALGDFLWKADLKTGGMIITPLSNLFEGLSGKNRY